MTRTVVTAVHQSEMPLTRALLGQKIWLLKWNLGILIYVNVIRSYNTSKVETLLLELLGHLPLESSNTGFLLLKLGLYNL